MELHELQRLYKEHLGEANHPRLAAYIALVEEVGELAQEVLNLEIYDKNEKANLLQDEIADVFICILELCDIYRIDLESVFLEKFRKVSEKARNEWCNSLTPLLKQKREQIDT